MASFSIEAFMEAFDKMSDVPDEGALLKSILSGVSPEERTVAEKSFHNTVRIMKAKTPEEVKDIPLEDILGCFDYQNIFNEVFCTDKGGVYIRSFRDGYKDIKSKRARRLL